MVTKERKRESLWETELIPKTIANKKSDNFKVPAQGCVVIPPWCTCNASSMLTWGKDYHYLYSVPKDTSGKKLESQWQKHQGRAEDQGLHRTHLVLRLKSNEL